MSSGPGGPPETLAIWTLHTYAFSATCRRLLNLTAPNPLLTEKDSIERSEPKTVECKLDVIARSLDAIGGWTSPVELPERGLCDLLFARMG